jgi:hypothetical protein
VDKLTVDLDLRVFHDEYKERIEALIKSKMKGDPLPLRSRSYIIKNIMLRQQSINSSRANGFVLIDLGATEFFKICAYFANLESSTTFIQMLSCGICAR